MPSNTHKSKKVGWNMNIIGDFHIHTLASGDAFGTINEMVEVAKARGLQCLAITEHGPKMPPSPHYYYYESLMDNVRGDADILIYSGVEANIIDEQGTLDLREETLKRLEFVLASFHVFSWEFGETDKERNTQALKACLSRYDNIKAVAHLNYPRYEVDMAEIIPLLVKKKIALELNNKALQKDRSRWQWFKDVVLSCRDQGVKFLVSSDAHYPNQVGNFKAAQEFIDFCGLTAEDIVNANLTWLALYLGLRTTI